MTCRCGHAWCQHATGYQCLICACPEYRNAETADTQTLKGIQT